MLSPAPLPRLTLPHPKARWPVGWWYWTAPPADRTCVWAKAETFWGVDAAGNPAVLGANSPLAVRRGIVVYDPQDNNWCALPGSSNELCTLNGKSLIEKMPLTAGDTFAVGGAQLRFVPLCGPEFNWNAAPKERK